MKCEGLPDAMALHSAGLPPGWIALTNACGATSANPENLDFSWANGKKIIVAGDADEPGQKGAKKFAKAFRAAGATEVRIISLPYDVTPNHGKDLRDWFAEGHTMADFAELAEAAPEWTESAEQDEHPVIIVSVDESRVVDQAIAALSSRQDLYQRGGLLVHVVRSTVKKDVIARDPDSPRIVRVRQPLLREMMADSVTWARLTEDDKAEPCHPPEWAVKAVDARDEWQRIRPIEGVIENPVLRPDGTILQSPGYDPQTGLLYCPISAFPPLEERPSKADAERAAQELLDVVADFPFASPIHRSGYLSGVLTPLARHAFAGCAPLHLINANTRGTGKGLLVDVMAIIATGRMIARTSAPRDDEEWRKRVTSIAIAAESLVLLDNLPHTLGSPSLDAALTATSWSDRVLGRSEMVTVPLQCTWYATGNNVMLIADTARRTLVIRLDSREENPEERQGFQHTDLLAWVRQERQRLTAAALTILAGYFAAGQPKMGLTPWGSYVPWSLVREAIVWAGQPDPAGNRREMVTQADQEADLLRRLLAGWTEIDPSCQGVTVAETLRILAAAPTTYQALRSAIEDMTPTGKPFNARSIGAKLHHLRHRVIGGRFFDKKDTNQGAAWAVHGVEGSDSKDSSDSSYSPSHARTHARTHAHARTRAGVGNTVTSVSTVTADQADCFHEWVEQPSAGRVKVVCRLCDKFFGYR